MIIDTLIDKIKACGNNPTVVGLDPRLSYIPDHIKSACYAEHGKTLRGAAEALYKFNIGIVDAVCDIVPAVKPQVAMYEQFGVEGMEAYLRTVAYAKSKGLLVIGDIKRSDIASTAEAYSDGHIGKVDVDGEQISVFDEDFITLNPYLGYDSIEPFLGNCQKYDRGLFLLVKTSNKGSADIQDLQMGEQKLYEAVGEKVANWGEGLIGKYGYSSVGAVVGATHPEHAAKLRAQLPHVFFLIPGYGAQGGTAEDLAVCFKDGIGGIVNSSRGIIAAYQNAKYREAFSPEDYAAAARQAALDMKEDLGRYIK